MSSDQERSQAADPLLDDLRQRLQALERENDRLRRQIEPILGPDNPCFDRAAFGRAMSFYVVLMVVPLVILSTLVPLLPQLIKSGTLSSIQFGPVRLVDFAGIGTNHPGIGVGVVAFGGLGVGMFAMGGLGVGLVALGGGAIGILAIGGGSLGIFALGGGACGYIAIGGNALGWYALGGSARGKYAFSLKRQDPEAVQLFTRLLPRFKAAVTTPLPVIPLEKKA